MRILVPILAIFVSALVAGEATTTTTSLSEETLKVGSKDVRVTADKNISFPFKAPEGLDKTELWYQSFDGAKWGNWQKHSQVFPKDSPVVWAPPEGHWQTYLRPILTSGLAGPDPSTAPDKVKPQKEFIIDRTTPAVAIAFPASKAKLRGGDKYTVTWNATDPYLRNAPVTIRWSLNGSGAFSVVADGIANSGSFEWTVPRDMTQTGVLRIEVADKAGNVGSAENTSILVDSIKPRGRVTGPAITASAQTNLDLEVSDAGAAGLTAARLWVSQDDGTSWIEGPTIEAPFKSVAWKAQQDGRYRFYVIATDGAGNISPAPKDKVGDVMIVDSAAPSVLLTSSIGISETTAAVGQSQRRDFKPGDRVQVVFKAADANLVPSSVSVLWQTDAGKPWVELAKGLPADQAYRFQIPADAPETKAARIKVTAADTAGNVGEVIAPEPFTIQTQVIDIQLEPEAPKDGKKP